MKVKHPARVAAILGICALLISVLLSNINSYNKIEDACINENNGDIAFAVHDPNDNGITLKVFDKNGMLKLERFYSAKGNPAVYLMYDGDELNLFIARTSTLHVLDAAGNEISRTQIEDREIEELEELTSELWEDFEQSPNKKTATHENVEYLYETTPLYRDLIGLGECKLSLEKSNGETVELYRS